MTNIFVQCVIFELRLLNEILEAETRDNIIFVQYNTALQYNNQLFYSLSYEYKSHKLVTATLNIVKTSLSRYSHYNELIKILREHYHYL